MADRECYEIYAIKYARNERRSGDNFIGGDPHDTPMPLDYFVWAITNENRTIILDTGFDEAMARRRGRDYLRNPGEGLAMIGIDPAGIEDVIISHMHYDHSGNESLFPNARYHVQDGEMAFCTGRHMCHEAVNGAFSADDVVAMVRRVFAGRVRFHDGTEELAPGITLHRVGGHTMGLQVTRVWTDRGWVVLASDASHFYANMEQGRPFPIVYDMGEVLEAYKIVNRLASSPDHIIPGHDPLVMTRYPAARPELDGIVARLDVAPTPGKS
jgi:glyoxylase-like metal-dependent hydrolase (beta-lactamase superfamily II)